MVRPEKPYPIQRDHLGSIDIVEGNASKELPEFGTRQATAEEMKGWLVVGQCTDMKPPEAVKWLSRDCE